MSPFDPTKIGELRAHAMREDTRLEVPRGSILSSADAIEFARLHQEEQRGKRMLRRALAQRRQLREMRAALRLLTSEALAVIELANFTTTVQRIPGGRDELSGLEDAAQAAHAVLWPKRGGPR